MVVVVGSVKRRDRSPVVQTSVNDACEEPLRTEALETRGAVAHPLSKQKEGPVCRNSTISFL